MKARASFYPCAVLVLMLAVGTGCSKAPSDAQMASDIEAKINADSGLQGKQLGVQAAGGVVTLSGTVDNDAQREAASRYAGSEAGVKQVFNNLQVTPPAQSVKAAPPARGKPKPAPAKHRSRPRKSEDDSGSASNQQEVAAATPAPAPATVVIPPPAPQPATPPTPPTTAATAESDCSLRYGFVGAAGGSD
jgi:hypothetical protein